MISSTSLAKAGSVSFSNATATIFLMPERRASAAQSRGKDRLPAMIPNAVRPEGGSVDQRFGELEAG